MTDEKIVIINESNEKPKGYNDTLLVYILYGLSLIIGITWIAALIYAYIKRDDLRDTIYYSHMNYVIRTCWWSLLWMVIGILTLAFFIGFFVIIGAAVWTIYRVVRGFINFKDGKAIN